MVARTTVPDLPATAAGLPAVAPVLLAVTRHFPASRPLLLRFRFAAAPELLAAWESASNVFTVAPSRPLPGGEGGAGESEVQPAA